ncbi:MAG: response regulator transcription factor [Clostridia bacterium]|nr:response regulator transcription factor [Clostridia bacterium]MBQ6893460.1 response regulator transcription factor [Clostridia bacterium]
MIFCVEDDEGIRNMMVYTLSASGFEAVGLSDGVALRAALEDRIPSLIMLDIMLPGDDGITLLKELKAHSATENIPVIMATAKGSEYDKVIGLDLGADDYLAKPFGMMEMVARVKAVLRRTRPASESESVRVGKLMLNKSEHTALVGDERVKLTLKEYELLCLFMENIGKVFTRDRLLQVVWGEDFLGETRTVDVHIGTLRAKLGECGDYIETVRGVGYRMEGDK